MVKKTVISKSQPKWLRKIVTEQVAAQNRVLQARIKLIEAKIMLIDMIDEINTKFKTEFTLNDIFGITPEEEDEVIDILDEE